MAETFERSSTSFIISQSGVDIYVAPSGNATDRAVILSCIVAATASDAQATINVSNSSNATLSSIGKNAAVPLASPVEFVTNKLVLKPGEKLLASVASAGSPIDCTVSVLEITA